MPGLKNVNLGVDARERRSAPVRIDISSTTLQTQLVLLDQDRDLKIKAVYAVYTVASDSGAVQNVEVGTAADPDAYVAFTPVASQSAGTVAEATLLSTANVSAGTPIFVRRANTTAGANTGELDVVVVYEVVDRALA